mgnify:CR=1 FL=1
MDGRIHVGDADAFEMKVPEDIAAAFVALGFPRPAEMPVMKLSYQIAQKLHAVSGKDSDRAHDLIDLQLMSIHSTPDYGDIRSTCKRLFAYRREQTWPPTIVKGENWENVYNEARETLRDSTSILSTVDEAVKWTNELIERIETVN